MTRWITTIFFTAITQLVLAQTEAESDISSTTAIFIAVLVVIVIIFILYNRQKRKFND